MHSGSKIFAGGAMLLLAAAAVLWARLFQRPVIPLAAGADEYSPPLLVTHGGTYRGAWTSDDPAVAAVTIETTEPVIIEKSRLRGRGNLIQTLVAHADLTVRDTTGEGVNPDVEGKIPGRFLTSEGFDRIDVENCSLDHTAGIYLLDYTPAAGGKGAPDGPSIRIMRNIAHDIDGRKSDGHDGWMDFNMRTTASGRHEEGFEPVQFVQFDKVRHAPDVEIAWNQVINDPGDSRVEDNISIYLSSGTADSPIRIHDNFIRGAYTIRPWEGSGGDDEWSYSGGGIMLGDGSPRDPSESSAFAVAENNQVVATTNYGIAISSGHDLSFSHNRLVASGKLADGRSIPAQNVGAYIWNIHGDEGKSSFFNDSGRSNVIGWMKGRGTNNAWTPDAAAWEGNTSLAPPIPRDAEEAEWQAWKKKLAAAGITIGPRT